MPASAAARTTRFSARAPARWPAPTGRWRSRAQRPLPSMMIATDSGHLGQPRRGALAARRRGRGRARSAPCAGG